jgi:hypothetical protein
MARVEARHLRSAREMKFTAHITSARHADVAPILDAARDGSGSFRVPL